MFAAPLCVLCLTCAPPVGDGEAGEPKALLSDDFDRTEADDAKEQVGGGWNTNSKSRAKGYKQVDLDGGAIHITRHAEADHGVSVRRDLPNPYENGTVSLRFRLPKGGDLGVDIADLSDKSVHAGHLLIVRVRPTKVELRDHKAGGMNKASGLWDRKKTKALTAADRQTLKDTVKLIPRRTAPGQWHTLSMSTTGDLLTVSVDGEKVGELKSPGIGHPTKRTVRLAVNSEAWVDDVKVVAANLFLQYVSAAVTGRSPSFARPSKNASSIRKAAAVTSAPASRASFRQAATVPPVASTSSTISAR